MNESKNRISDEEFMKNYVRHNKNENRSEKYVKGKDSGKLKGFGFMIFLAIVFLLAYYLFSEFIFFPQV